MLPSSRSTKNCLGTCLSAALLATACGRVRHFDAARDGDTAGSSDGLGPGAGRLDDSTDQSDPAAARAIASMQTSTIRAAATGGRPTPAASLFAVTQDPYLAGRPVSARSIGHTSYVLKVKLDNGLTAAYKPRSRLVLGDRRYRGEIAAYRLGRALGLNNVPCAMPRSFVARDLRAAFATAEGVEEFDRKALVDPAGTVRGALIPWIDRYEEIPLEKPEARRRWEPWLTDPDARIAVEDRPMASALSTMLVFDYITGNWDRWSGGNVVRDGATGTILFVDNDGAFYELAPKSLEHQADLLRRVLRFSASFVRALRALDVARLRDVFGDESESKPLLPQHTIDGVDARRRTALGFVDAATARWGAPVTLAFE